MARRARTRDRLRELKVKARASGETTIERGQRRVGRLVCSGRGAVRRVDARRQDRARGPRAIHARWAALRRRGARGAAVLAGRGIAGRLARPSEPRPHAWVGMGEELLPAQLVAGTLMVVALAVVYTERHGHLHTHERLTHTHWHRHDDDHHDHDHQDTTAGPSAWHIHEHPHEALTHDHRHRPDLHHRHVHAPASPAPLPLGDVAGDGRRRG